MQHNLVKIVFLTLAALGLPALAQAQASASNSASVTVEEQAITLVALDGLDLGTVLAFGRPGSVTVTPGGTTSASNAFSSVPGAPATFEVTGVPNAPYGISLPADGAVTVTSGADSMTLRNFNRSGGTSQLSLDATGQASFAVGATLDVGARQPAGTYTGTFNVTVDYN